jgi:adenosylcobinamide-GDP ribazoletransferase
MSNSDIRQFQSADVIAALGLLTRIPVKVDHEVAGARAAKAVWAYPLAGLTVGVIAACVGSIWQWIGLSDGLVAAAVLAIMVIITGAMHEDGLADSADGLWGGWDRDRRLEIMKDSRIGSYGVIALCLSLLARWIAIEALISAGWMWCALPIVATLSRVPMVALMHLMEPARAGGLSRSVGRPDKAPVGVALLIGLAVAAALGGWTVFPLFIFVTLATVKVALIAQAKIGGQTGDILGAAQQIAEITALGVLASIAG